jgi:hypothetical protein
MKICNDESLFAWEDASIYRGGLLAPWPSCFKFSHDVRSVHPQHLPRPPYAMTNNGLEFEVTLIQGLHLGIPGSNGDAEQIYKCPLNCVREGNMSRLLAPFLSSQGNFKDQHFSRAACGLLGGLDTLEIATENSRQIATSRKIFVQQPHITTRALRGSRAQCIFRIKFQKL